MKIKENAYAKINLYLDITDKQDNGYHGIYSLMQTVSLCDVIYVSILPANKTEITVESKDTGMPKDERNTAYKAAMLFLEKAEINAKINIEIEKNVPSGAGLGGGSGDAAAVLRVLRRELSPEMTDTELNSIAAKVGADVPFMVKGSGSAICEGIGDIMKRYSPIPHSYIVIAKGDEGISTHAAYKMLDGIYNDFEASRYPKEETKKALISNDIGAISSVAYNIFEEAILPSCEEAADIKRFMKQNGAILSMMTGSGSAVFGIYQNKEEAEMIKEKLKMKGYFAAVATPV